MVGRVIASIAVPAATCGLTATGITPARSGQGGTGVGGVWTDTARHAPGDTVTVTAEAEGNGEVHFALDHLGATIDEQIVQSNGSGQVQWTLAPPSHDFMGYVAHVSTAGSEAQTAIDVSSDWTRLPRIRHLDDHSGHAGTASDNELVRDLSEKHHLNTLQFCDWMWHHGEPIEHGGGIPPSRTAWNGDVISSDSAESFVEDSQEANTATLPYSMGYAALDRFESNGVDDAWGLNRASDAAPWEFEMLPNQPDTTLWMMDPTNQGWLSHIIDRHEDQIDSSSFDGTHLDQLGNWGRKSAVAAYLNHRSVNGPRVEAETGQRAGGSVVSSNHSGFEGSGFVDNFGRVGDSVLLAVTAPGSRKYGIVPVWPRATGSTAARTVRVDGEGVGRPRMTSTAGRDSWSSEAGFATYLPRGEHRIAISVDEGDSGFVNLDSLVLGGCGTPSVQLANAAFASKGASRVERGKGNGMLVAPCFVDDSKQMDPELSAGRESCHDVITAHETLSYGPNLHRTLDDVKVEGQRTSVDVASPDVDGGRGADGTPLRLWHRASVATQEWSSDGAELMAMGMCLDVDAGGVEDGSQRHLWQCGDISAQTWFRTPQSQFCNPAGGTCSDVSAQLHSDGARTQSWTCHSGGSQKWTLPR